MSQERINFQNEHFLSQLLNPKSIAFYGASENILANMGTAQLLNILDNGYKGRVYPIHLRLPEILGLIAYKKVGDLPEIPDLAIIILPNRVIPQIFEELRQKGTKYVVLVTAGFRELENASGEVELKKIAKECGIRFLGPNCLGLLNTHCKFSSNEDICILNCMWVNYPVGGGNISIASQSGTFAAHSFMMLKERGIGFAYSLSIGNEANVDIVDCLEFFESDQFTDVICLYIEEIKRGKEFFQAASRISQKKPILAIYVGGSEIGARAVASHTGSMAGNDLVFDGMFKQAGIIRAFDIEELIDAASMFSKFVPKGAIPMGKRIAVVTNACGPGITIADRASRLGLEVPKFSDPLKDKIQPFLPATARANNPLDYTFSINPAVFFEKIPKLLAKSEEVDAIIIYGGYGADFIRVTSEIGIKYAKTEENLLVARQFNEIAEGSIDSARFVVKKQKVPICYVNMLGLDDELFIYLNKQGFPTYRMPHQAINALFHLIEYGQYFHKRK
jgi:acyl-CoA synthetase (NDP forming)